LSAATALRCIDCDRAHPLEYLLNCPDCGGLLFVEYDLDRIAGIQFGNLDGPGIWPYAELLPISDPANFVTLGEGSTPLIAVPRLAAEIGLDNLWIKFDGLNPTGTVKDRSAVTAVSAALQFGFDRIGVVSTGNAATSIAAYAARAGIKALVLSTESSSRPKVCHVNAITANFMMYRGGYDDMIGGYDRAIDDRVVFDGGASRNPYKQDGKKTLAYEVFEQMGLQSPDYVVYPVGMGEMLLASQRGFRELHAAGHADSVPIPIAAQSSVADTIVKALNEGGPRVPITIDYTMAEGVAVGDMGPKGDWVLDDLRAAGGLGAAAMDAEIIEWQTRLARLEGIWAGPTGCVTLPALAKLVRDGKIPTDARVVCNISETGLKSDIEPPDIAVIDSGGEAVLQFLQS
jgi:threonine synthase